jgi:hypothetical protein
MGTCGSTIKRISVETAPIETIVHEFKAVTGLKFTDDAEYIYAKLIAAFDDERVKIEIGVTKIVEITSGELKNDINFIFENIKDIELKNYVNVELNLLLSKQLVDNKISYIANFTTKQASLKKLLEYNIAEKMTDCMLLETSTEAEKTIKTTFKTTFKTSTVKISTVKRQFDNCRYNVSGYHFNEKPIKALLLIVMTINLEMECSCPKLSHVSDNNYDNYTLSSKKISIGMTHCGETYQLSSADCANWNVGVPGTGIITGTLKIIAKFGYIYKQLDSIKMLFQKIDDTVGIALMDYILKKPNFNEYLNSTYVREWDPSNKCLVKETYYGVNNLPQTTFQLWYPNLWCEITGSKLLTFYFCNVKDDYILKKYVNAVKRYFVANLENRKQFDMVFLANDIVKNKLKDELEKYNIDFTITSFSQGTYTFYKFIFKFEKETVDDMFERLSRRDSVSSVGSTLSVDSLSPFLENGIDFESTEDKKRK